MRIAVVHSYYSSQKPSGENVAVDTQVTSLRSAGHDVAVIAQHTDERLRRRSYPIAAATATAAGWGPDPTQRLREFGPDVVHVHNLFPNYGTRWLRAWRGPVVATLHNYRSLCATGTLFRDGSVCTLCPDGDRLAGMRHRCFHGSALATMPLTIRNFRGPGRDAVIARADRVVVLCERSRELYRTYGVDAERLTLVPNLVPEPHLPDTFTDDRTGWVFVGRLTEEKGVVELVTRWPPGEELHIVGSGPLEPYARRVAPASVRFHGQLPRQQVLSLVAASTGLVLPSRCFEAAVPLVVIEALACGTPIVTRADNAAADLVHDAGCGGVVPTARDDDWEPALARVRNAGAELRLRARRTYEADFAPEIWLSRIEAVYEAARARPGIHR